MNLGKNLSFDITTCVIMIDYSSHFSQLQFTLWRSRYYYLYLIAIQWDVMWSSQGLAQSKLSVIVAIVILVIIVDYHYHTLTNTLNIYIYIYIILSTPFKLRVKNNPHFLSHICYCFILSPLFKWLERCLPLQSI